MAQHYYKIDVPHATDGYSFMVVAEEEMDELDVIDKCVEQNLFNDSIDADYARIDDLVTQYDIDHFKSCTHKI